MTEKELRRMGRGDLIEIIYEYQKREKQLEEENAELKRKLDERKIMIDEAGSIAEAALSINKVFEAAQAAADQYLEEIHRVYGEVPSGTKPNCRRTPSQCKKTKKKTLKDTFKALVKE